MTDTSAATLIQIAARKVEKADKKLAKFEAKSREDFFYAVFDAVELFETKAAQRAWQEIAEIDPEVEFWRIKKHVAEKVSAGKWVEGSSCQMRNLYQRCSLAAWIKVLDAMEFHIDCPEFA
ncbi:hypothetical protein BB934_45300 (plasmid) [Microvirga ossetica]|uniref:Uncharacterized protein n=1 Tax=Microvirga ossetica TaxID=1882682 RepID=A0A1B2EZU3_9HYPH|nr:hypothetical protein [Microvirga ossetica]ANY85438.1 hypothetical protein BB934_45300 [Microvirga ossetica]